jgi:glycosyltransferase involved in cell wall biosynthesis
MPLVGQLVKRRFSPGFAAAVRRRVRHDGFELVHAHIYASATAAAAALAGSRVPLVLTEHTEAPWRGRRARSASRLAYRRADHLITVSTAIRRQLVEEFGVPRAGVTYVPNAVVPLADAARAVGVRDGFADRPLIARVSRLVPEKGVDVFLRAAAIVAARAPEVRFLVIGDGPLREELRGLADDLSLTDRVSFLGHRPDARRVIARLSMLVVSSITDGAPLVNLEAMSAGVPVVASACGGIPDQIRDGADGLLVEPGDPHMLAAAMLRVLAEPDLARRRADCARRRAESEFSYPAMLARVEECYRAAAARRQRATRPVRTPVPGRVPVP